VRDDDGPERNGGDVPGGGCPDAAAVAAEPAPPRPALLRHGLRLEYVTVGWNVVEGVVSVLAALAAGSVALLGFGIDSFVETTSGLILVWRLHAERRARDPEAIERLDRRARRLVGLSLFLLAAYIAFDAARALITRERPEPTVVGIVITSISLVVMAWLARAKRRTAQALGSRALEADSFQTTACFWLSVITLAGIGLNAACGWWWADPAAALGMTTFLVSEGREAWRGEECACGGGSCT
jgi:divalent metal cation (Fe/Co/Zn/Cd) transporter